ncbi:visual pigment-like receptor peropsin isoform X2 [Pristis pectinata]|uniref:visual pigment-like receptor peropsin isoform X2 n=1 Tax=Pristis pectinata TaxID=685728 RepID=UPI00223C9D1F|nr:visual pigment-like receptor peropsin isoform X2 [Pristis pectinata]
MEDPLENPINSSTGSTEMEPKSVFSQMEHNIVAAYLITAGILSLLSNIVVLIMFVKFKEFRTATNAIIVNLAFTDIGAYAALNIFFGMASIGLLTVVAIDRYLTISKPELGRKMTGATYTALITVAWVNGLFWALMPVVGWASYGPDPTGATCTINWRNNDSLFVSYTMTVIAVNFVVPLSIMFFCYYNVSKTMKRLTQHNGLENVTLDWSDQLDVTKMSVVMIIMFLVAWSPYSIVCLWSSFGNPKLIPPAMAIIAPLFAKSSTFYNPCIYVIANKKFRRAIIAMIRCQTQQDLTISHTLPMTTSRIPLAE